MQIYMSIYDERTEDLVNGEAELNLKTGEISNVIYKSPHDYYNSNKHFTINADYYEDQYGKLKAEIFINERTIVFNVDINDSSDFLSYSVNSEQLKNIHKDMEKLGLSIGDIESVPKKRKP